jgi:hypothetical protein
MNTLSSPPEWVKMGYLWYNVVGCLLVVLVGATIQLTLTNKNRIVK